MKELKDLKLKSQSELKKLSEEKLKEEVVSAEKKMYILSMKLSVGELKQTHLLRFMRRYVALLKTLLQNAKS